MPLKSNYIMFLELNYTTFERTNYNVEKSFLRLAHKLVALASPEVQVNLSLMDLYNMELENETSFPLLAVEDDNLLRII
ncbi:hypothetical protein H8356DRAFT_1433347 [Neocallimastix lanati (nom. inval.)]|nr:hypothetical protein H8356DRAFT_1433347 [Neocallimastix sp. JGI-2020a]